MTDNRWLLGKRFVRVNARTGKRTVWWVSRWLAHRCADLAIPLELGRRVMAAEWVALAAVLIPHPSPPALPDPACAVPVPFHCDPRPR